MQSLEIQADASLTLLRSVLILADEFVCKGTCEGCERKVLVEGAKTTTTALRQ